MQSAFYLSNRSPHAALNNGTPYKAHYGKDAHPDDFRVVTARAFVYVETHTKKLEHRACEGRLVGYSLGSNSGLQFGDEKCAGESKRHSQRDASPHA